MVVISRIFLNLLRTHSLSFYFLINHRKHFLADIKTTCAKVNCKLCGFILSKKFFVCQNWHRKWFSLLEIHEYLSSRKTYRLGCAVPYSDVSKVWNWIFPPLEIDSCIKNSGWLKYEPSRSSISPGYCPFCVT